MSALFRQALKITALGQAAYRRKCCISRKVDCDPTATREALATAAANFGLTSICAVDDLWRARRSDESVDEGQSFAQISFAFDDFGDDRFRQPQEQGLTSRRRCMKGDRQAGQASCANRLQSGRGVIGSLIATALFPSTDRVLAAKPGPEGGMRLTAKGD